MPEPKPVINKCSRDYDQEIITWIGNYVRATHHTAIGEQNKTGKLLNYKPKTGRYIIQLEGQEKFIPTQEWTITHIGKKKN